jgi:hypothetical protein
MIPGAGALGAFVLRCLFSLHKVSDILFMFITVSESTPNSVVIGAITS